ncbi:MAG TPA: hypothetical protein VMU29_14285 [Smithella sp.]|nr:hypothetical protein [Smithella sp.]
MNRKSVILAFISICLTMAFLTGCATTKQIAPVASGPIPANSARIIVLREGGFAGSAAPVGVKDNGTQIGEVGLHSQLAWDRVAGPMQLIGFNTLDPVNTLTPPIQMCIGAGMTYKFMVSWPINFNHYPTIVLVSGTPVACEQFTAANAKEGKQSQPSPAASVASTQVMPAASAQSDGTSIIAGKIEDYATGFRFKSGPPLWPCGAIKLLTDPGMEMSFLVVGDGEHATLFYDVNGNELGNLASGRARVIKGKRAEVKYVESPSTAIKTLAVSVRYLE